MRVLILNIILFLLFSLEARMLYVYMYVFLGKVTYPVVFSINFAIIINIIIILLIILLYNYNSSCAYFFYIIFALKLCILGFILSWQYLTHFPIVHVIFYFIFILLYIIHVSYVIKCWCCVHMLSYLPYILIHIYIMVPLVSLLLIYIPIYFDIVPYMNTPLFYIYLYRFYMLCTLLCIFIYIVVFLDNFPNVNSKIFNIYRNRSLYLYRCNQLSRERTVSCDFSSNYNIINYVRYIMCAYSYTCAVVFTLLLVFSLNGLTLMLLLGEGYYHYFIPSRFEVSIAEFKYIFLCIYIPVSANFIYCFLQCTNIGMLFIKKYINLFINHVLLNNEYQIEMRFYISLFISIIKLIMLYLIIGKLTSLGIVLFFTNIIYEFSCILYPRCTLPECPVSSCNMCKCDKYDESYMYDLIVYIIMLNLYYCLILGFFIDLICI